MIPAIDLATILLMALATYATRAGGYLLLRHRILGRRARAVMAEAFGIDYIPISGSRHGIACRCRIGRPGAMAWAAATMAAASMPKW